MTWCYRASGIAAPTATALLVGCIGLFLGKDAITLPTVPAAVNLSSIVPPFGAMALAPGLVEQFSFPMSAAPLARARLTYAVRATWFLMGVTVLAVCAAAGGQDLVYAAATCWFGCVALVAATLIGHWSWAPLLLLGYGWLQLTSQGTSLEPAPGVALGAATLVLCSIAYLMTVPVLTSHQAFAPRN